jgi:hypothetical protein
MQLCASSAAAFTHTHAHTSDIYGEFAPNAGRLYSKGVTAVAVHKHVSAPIANCCLLIACPSSPSTVYTTTPIHASDSRKPDSTVNAVERADRHRRHAPMKACGIETSNQGSNSSSRAGSNSVKHHCARADTHCAQAAETRSSNT